MALLDAALNSMGDDFGALATHASIHTADPGATGTNESTAARAAISWASAANGDVTLASDLGFTGGAASGAVTHVGFWDASTGGTFLGSAALSGGTTFTAAGGYTVTALTVAGTSA